MLFKKLFKCIKRKKREENLQLDNMKNENESFKKTESNLTKARRKTKACLKRKKQQ